jgi:Family of unknown function (DUF6788)
MALSLADLEHQRFALRSQLAGLGDFRSGSVSGTGRRCGNPRCHCHQANDPATVSTTGIAAGPGKFPAATTLWVWPDSPFQPDATSGNSYGGRICKVRTALLPLLRLPPRTKPVIAMEETSFLLPVQRIVGSVQIQNVFLRRSLMGFQEDLHQQAVHGCVIQHDLFVALPPTGGLARQFQSIQSTFPRRSS